LTPPPELPEILRVSVPPSVAVEVSVAGEREAGRAGLAHRVAGWLLVLLAFVLPFEAPLFRLGPLQITSVELVLYGTLAAWGLAVALDLPRSGSSLRGLQGALRAEPLGQGAALWALVLFASALAAPSFRAEALKFALRSTSGVLVFFAARTLARSPTVARRVSVSLLAGALVSATSALVEGLGEGTDLWMLFRASSFGTLGLRRASGVFAYPTIGAMYWEAAVPMAVLVPLLARGPTERRAWNGVAVALLGSAWLFAAILASATRAALAGAAMSCVALIGLGWRSGRWLRRTGTAVLCVLFLTSWLAVSATSSGALLGQRLRWWQDDAWFRAEYTSEGGPLAVRAGQALTVPLRLRNTGTLPWKSGGARPVRLGCHWYPAGRVLTVGDYEGTRTDLPADVPPGSALELIATVRSPELPGTYRLRWDLVEEHVTWFSERGIPMPAQSVIVESTSEGPPRLPVSAASSRPLAERSAESAPRRTLWRSALVLWRGHPLLGVGPDNFRRRYEEVIGLDPNGQAYTDTRIHANSFYLETLADLGLAGAAVLAWLGLSLLRALRDLSASGRLAGLGWGLAAAAFFVHGLVDYFLEFTPLFGLFWMLLGLTAACAEGPPPGALRGSRR
jgi:hypothetical protein